MYKLVVLDIDGTLVTSEKKVTDKTREYIKKASDMGVKFIIASGRAPSGILQIAKEIELENIGGYILAFNGGTCINCEDMSKLYANFINKEHIKKVYDFAKSKNVPLVTYKDEILYTPNDTTEYIDLEARINNLKIVKTKNFIDEVNFDVPKFILTDNKEKIAEIVEEAKVTFPDFEVFTSEPFFLEISPKNIHKATGIEQVIEILGIKREEVIAIGDGLNDYTMIEYAGLGVAMGNAQKPILDIADYITLSNDEDGVCKVIEEFILKK